VLASTPRACSEKLTKGILNAKLVFLRTNAITVSIPPAADHIRIGERRVDSLSVDEFAYLREDSHAFFAEQIVDKSLARIRMRAFVAEQRVMAVAHHLPQSDIIHGRTFCA
jgi:hypothetical protein